MMMMMMMMMSTQSDASPVPKQPNSTLQQPPMPVVRHATTFGKAPASQAQQGLDRVDGFIHWENLHCLIFTMWIDQSNQGHLAVNTAHTKKDANPVV